MRNLFISALSVLLFGCGPSPGSHDYSGVAVEVIHRDSASFRALEVLPGSIGFAGSDGTFGSISLQDLRVRSRRLEYQGSFPEFRSVAHTDGDFFMLSAGDPALLYKTGDAGDMELVYLEEGPGVFYDSMKFWDNSEGLAVGDAMGGCLSILITRDGGHNWNRLSCDALPAALPGEGAFAASNTNIAISGDQCWIATSRGRIFYSPDRGQNWEVYQTPADVSRESQGLFSLDFHDGAVGFAIGGDYADAAVREGNKILSRDGGRSWIRVADGANPGYKSCVRFVPGSGGKDLVAVGYTGIAYSGNQGMDWTHLSDEGFYTLRFVNDSVAFAGGNGRLARLVFR